MMDRREFDLLVASIDREYQDRTDALTRHTYRWMLLGYMAIILMTVSLIGTGLALFLAGLVWSHVGIAMVIVGGLLIVFGVGQVGALVFVDQPEPRGIDLAPQQAPNLRQLVGMLCREMKSPLPQKIILTEDFNAAIAQRPRLGIFGWSQSSLILGVPLMLAISPEELASVLAHECGHLSLKHGHQGSRIYQMHESWERLFQKLQQKQGGGLKSVAGSLVIRFLNWYWPRFHARAFVLSRRNEFLADRRSAEATSVETTADALFRIECLSYFLEHEFWKETWDDAEHQDQPPDDLTERLRAAYRSAAISPQASRWRDQAIQRVSGSEETHPAMAERLAALGQSPEQIRQRQFPDSPDPNAFDALFGDDAADLEQAISARWKEQVSAIWQDRHRRITALRTDADIDDSVFPDGDRSAAELWARARRVLDASGLAAAEPLLRQILESEPQHTGANMAFGQLRLEQGHEDGVQILKSVFDQQNADWTGAAAAVLEQHYITTGQKQRAGEVRTAMDQFDRDRAAAEQERFQFKKSDVWIEHGLTEFERSVLSDEFRQHESCRRVWLARKRVQHFPDEHLYVLVVESNGPRRERPTTEDELIAPLMVKCELPGRLLVIADTGEFRRAARQIRNLPGSLIYEFDNTTSNLVPT